MPTDFAQLYRSRIDFLDHLQYPRGSIFHADMSTILVGEDDIHTHFGNFDVNI